MIYRSVIFPLVKDGSLIVYPDDRALFRDCAENGDGSVIGEYSGDLPLDDYIDPSIDVVITSISGDGYLGGDNSLFYAKELLELSIVATIDKPDGTQLVLPMRREDTGRVIYKFASVLAGSVSFDFAFPTSGKWECTESLINTTAAGDDTFVFAGVVAIVDL